MSWLACPVLQWMFLLPQGSINNNDVSDRRNTAILKTTMVWESSIAQGQASPYSHTEHVLFSSMKLQAWKRPAKTVLWKTSPSVLLPVSVIESGTAVLSRSLFSLRLLVNRPQGNIYETFMMLFTDRVHWSFKCLPPDLGSHMLFCLLVYSFSAISLTVGALGGRIIGRCLALLIRGDTMYLSMKSLDKKMLKMKIKILNDFQKD